MKPKLNIVKTIHKGRLIKWTYQGTKQAELVALAELGQSNKVILRATGFSQNEVNYALKKAQDVMKGSGGFRRNWANGTSPIIQQVKRDLLEVLRRNVQESLPMQILNPEAQTVDIQEVA